MSGSKSDYLEKALLDTVLGGPSYTPPGTVHVALFTVAPSDSGGGTEVSGNNYSRAATTNDATHWPAASGSLATKSNGVAVVFPQASGSWGTVVAFGIFDSATLGNLLYWGDISPSKTVGANDTAEFAIGSITLTED